ncbi:thermonuclease family protein [Aminobacter sp. HY435]|uniref:thermonuclease family protein n=1 Tax=Aminobacter sp. HY435 TaxID=2970917 RepID=UPI0022B95AA3|nr:thermonuclease family protein [Aminobacter sp. HY435]
MKASALAMALAGFGLAVLIVNAGGHRLSAFEAPLIDAIDESDLPDDFDLTGEEDTAAVEPEPEVESGPEPVSTQSAPARSVAGGEIAPPASVEGGLVREPPRAPLSELSLALPPKPKVTAEWDGATLFRPVASAAGVIDAKGLQVSIAGLTPLDLAETCSVDGKQWNCGVRARTALRGLLRGRAVVCDIPADKDQGEVVARCRIGKLDVGEWLVANGWAKPLADGPYAEAGKKAEQGKKGIFGSAPERVEMTLTPNATNLPDIEAPPLGLPEGELVQ